MLLGLVTPDAGSATIGGRDYRDLSAPSDVVGAALEATGFHPSRTGLNHLRVYCTVNGYPARRAAEVIALVGLDEARDRPVGGYSLGMRQRLALAAALLGDPAALILDEPANGLDPEGIVWMRRFLREYADGGRTVLVSSHVLTEMQQLVDHVVILNRGRLVQQGSLAELSTATPRVVVRSPDTERLLQALGDVVPAGIRAEVLGPDTVQVRDLPAHEIGRVALAAGVELHELTPGAGTLEQVFFDLTRGLESA
jgi:ABC-2 type transport system ATP-binding protein